MARDQYLGCGHEDGYRVLGDAGRQILGRYEARLPSAPPVRYRSKLEEEQAYLRRKLERQEARCGKRS